MLPRSPAPMAPSDDRVAVSTRLLFFIAGFAMAAWAPLVPFAQQRAGLDEAQLGGLLLCMGVGSILAMPFSGALTVRWGCRRVLIVGTLLLCSTLPALATLSNPPGLVLSLFMFGAAMGVVECNMNIQAVIVERAAERPLMSGFHGFFSLGGIAAAGVLSALLSSGFSPSRAILAVVFGILVAFALALPHSLAYGVDPEGPTFAIPRGPVLWLGALCFVVFLTEGSVLDWSAVFLTSQRGVDPGLAGLGYGCFALTMTAGRLAGDRVVAVLGRRRVVFWGGLCAAAGMAVATSFPDWRAGLLGYALVGVGCSNLVPVFYTAAGSQKVMPESLAIPAITTLGYSGILLGPAGIGFLARATSLSTALLLLAALLLGVAACSRLPLLRD